MQLSEMEIVDELNTGNIDSIIEKLSEEPKLSVSYMGLTLLTKQVADEIWIAIELDEEIISVLGSKKDGSGYYMMKNAYVFPKHRNNNPNLLAVMVKYLAREIIKDTIISDIEMTPEAVGSWKKMMASNLVNMYIWDRVDKKKTAYYPNKQPMYYDPLNKLKNIDDVGSTASDKHRFVWLVEHEEHLYEGLIDPRRYIKFFNKGEG